MADNVKRHTVKSAFGGLFLGLGLAILVGVFALVQQGSPLQIALVVLGILAGVAWSFAGPAQRPKV